MLAVFFRIRNTFAKSVIIEVYQSQLKYVMENDQWNFKIIKISSNQISWRHNGHLQHTGSGGFAADKRTTSHRNIIGDDEIFKSALGWKTTSGSWFFGFFAIKSFLTLWKNDRWKKILIVKSEPWMPPYLGCGHHVSLLPARTIEHVKISPNLNEKSIVETFYRDNLVPH